MLTIILQYSSKEIIVFKTTQNYMILFLLIVLP